MFVKPFPKGCSQAELVTWINEMNDAVPGYINLVALLDDPERVFTQIERIIERQLKKAG
jgi:hypothetical protein